MAKKRRRTAVLFVHVQGEQSPMDDLLQLAYTIWETDPKAAPGGQLGNLISVPRETAEEGDAPRAFSGRRIRCSDANSNPPSRVTTA